MSNKTLNINPQTTETEMRMDENDPKVHSANAQLKFLGKELTPPGTEYIGSMCVHIYSDKFNVGYQFMSMHPTGKATEAACIMAYKRLQAVVMASFGRSQPKVRS